LKSVLDGLTSAGNEYWESKQDGKHQHSTKPDKPASGNANQAAAKSSGQVSNKNQGADSLSQARTVAADRHQTQQQADNAGQQFTVRYEPIEFM